MERRLLLAIVLMIAVAVLPSLFLRPAPRAPAGGPDTTALASPVPGDSAASTAPPDRPPGPAVSAPPADTASLAPRADTVLLEADEAVYAFTTRGAALSGATMRNYRGLAGRENAPAQLVRPDDRLLATRLVVGADTVRFDSAHFAVEPGEALAFSGVAGGLRLRLAYTAVQGRDYLLRVTGAVEGLQGRGSLLLVGLGHGFANVEADSLDNYRHYGLSTRARDVRVHNFRSVDPGERVAIDGPFDWVAVKSKYFIGAVLAPDSTARTLGGAVLVGQPRENRLAKTGESWVTLPVGPDARFRFDFYLGPQRHRTLSPIGRQLDKASPYGWIFKGIVMPVSGWITRLLLWMHETLQLSYGWVLVIFGVLVRLVLWPLNQRAMKSQVAMMAVQPLLQDLQKRYKNDPPRLQQEMLKVYREHKVNPLGGCLPMLLPLPILLALFFVFANTIELRGAGFLWLPDLSLKDPTYAVPLVMGGSMFALSKLSQLGMPPNPQARIMTIVMPIMMTIFFLNFASGLNLYYAVMNLVSLPQQWWINKARAAEMARRQVQLARS